MNLAIHKSVLYIYLSNKTSRYMAVMDTDAQARRDDMLFNWRLVYIALKHNQKNTYYEMRLRLFTHLHCI